MHLFFYGTLIAGSGNAAARAAHVRLREMGPATVRGRLFAIPHPQGWYPALLPGPGCVQGRLYRTAPGFGAAELAMLDIYEEYDPSRPSLSLYVRRTVEATCGEGARRSAQAYRFNRPLPPRARPVPDGDFWSWLARARVTPFDEARRPTWRIGP